MGHQQSRGNNSTQNINHSKFGKVTFPVGLLEKESQIMEVDLPCDEASYKKWKLDLKKNQTNFSNMKYLLLPVNHKFSTGGLCSQSGIVKVAYQKLPYILEDQISALKQKKHTFSEPQLWKLLYVIVSAKNEYLDLIKDTSLNLGNINPKNIFLNQKGSIRLSNPLSWPNHNNGYRSALLKQTSYLSPQDMRCLQLGASNNDGNINSQQFSIGMTLLSAGLVENLQHLYNLQNNTLNKVQFQQKLILWKTTMYYSQILRAVIICLLDQNPSKRMNLRQISEFLRPHISNIESQKPLKINNTTKKIQSQIEKLRQQMQRLLRYRFEKYSPQKTRQINQRSLPKQSRKNSPPKSSINRPLIHNLYSNASMNPQEGQQTIARVKSQTRFTYSNQPLANVAPVKFVLEGRNQPTIQTFQSGNNGPPPVSIFIQQNSVSPRGSKIIVNKQKQSNPVIQEFHSAPIEEVQQNKIHNSTVRPSAKKQAQIIDEIFPPHYQKVQQNLVKTQEIAQKLVDQGLTHADSEIHIQPQNRQSSSTAINKLQQNFIQQSINQDKVIFQKKQKGNYQTYAEILIKCDFEAAWIQYIAMIHRPDLYFHQLENKVTLTDNIIEIHPGKVRFAANKQEGKVHLQNLSNLCQGEILGGVSKYSSDEVQVWFNSSYTFNYKPFPGQDHFVRSLQMLKKKLQ